MGRLLQDLRYGLRTLIQNPRFTLTAVLTLALGIGLNGAIFTMFDAFFLRSLPVPRPADVVRLFYLDDATGDYADSFSYATLRDLREQVPSLASVSSRALARASLSYEGTTQLTYGEVVSGNYFDTLAVKMSLGRGFRESESIIGGEPAVVLSDRLWRDRFGADPTLVGKVVRLNNRPLTVVGIAPPEFVGTKAFLAMAFWTPLETWRSGSGRWVDDRSQRSLSLIARLAPGRSLEQAESELAVLSARLGRSHIEEEGRSIQAQPARGLMLDADPGITRVARLGGTVAMGAVGLVLLVACANIANLILARASTRRREIGIRLAIGASKWRVVRQLLTESLLLALVGGAAGVAVAYWAAESMTALFPIIPYTIVFDTAPNPRILLFAFGVSSLTGLLFGLAPALRTVRSNLAASLGANRSGGGSARRAGIGQMLVATQVALSVVLLVVTGVFVQSLGHLTTLDTGFANRNLAFLSVDFDLAGLDPAAGRAMYESMEQRLGSLPGVAAVGLTNNLPLDDSNSSTRVWGEIVSADDRRGLRADFVAVSSDYFKAMGIDLLEGRAFDRSDEAGATPVLMVNRALAERLWGSANVVGKRIATVASTGPFYEIVGVVETIKQRSLVEDPSPALYGHLPQSYTSRASVVLHTSSRPETVLNSAREVIRDINPAVPVFDAKGFRDFMSYPLWSFQLGATLSTVFGALALVLTAVGLYGLVSYTVAQRTSEIGIRMALGADRGAVRSMILKRGGLLIAVGGAIGLAGALVMSSFLSTLIFGVTASDPATLTAVVAVISAVALFACYLPARRASRVNPIEALRTE